jgi:hypothetical protein
MRLALVRSLTIPIEAERDAGAPPTSYDAFLHDLGRSERSP